MIFLLYIKQLQKLKYEIKQLQVEKTFFFFSSCKSGVYAMRQMHYTSEQSVNQYIVTSYLFKMEAQKHNFEFKN